MKTTPVLCFLLGHLALALGQPPSRGDTRVVMMVSDSDDCKNDASCYQELVSKTKNALNDKNYQNLSTAAADSTTTNGDGNLRGRRLCDEACVAQYGIHICIFYGWCRRRELTTTTVFDSTTEADQKKEFFNDVDSTCWTYQGVEYDAKFMSLIPGELTSNKLKTSGVSFRTQIYTCD